MYTDERTRRRELVTAIALTAIMGVGIFGVLLLLTGWLVLAVLAAVVAIAVVGFFQYAVWGRRLARVVRRKEVTPPPPPARYPPPTM